MAPSLHPEAAIRITDSGTRKGILIGMLSAFGSAAVVAFILLLIWFFQYTQRGRILLDRLGRPGEYDDEQAFAKEEAEALETMDDMQRMEYMRAKAFVQANPPESVQTDISLSQFLAIQEKGVSAWEFEPELEIANCFVEGRTEIEFFDAECSVQSNLPVPKQNEVYYWESKVYDKPENTLISIGMSTKPYPLFQLPGWHKHSVAYVSNGQRRHNQPFTGSSYGPEYVQGDVIGCGYRPRTGTIFFTRNGKKLDDVVHGLKSQNFFPTIGANGPCQIHVNFGQLGFVFIEANVKKWGLAPMTGSLAPPPPYGSEQGSILLEGGREGIREVSKCDIRGTIRRAPDHNDRLLTFHSPSLAWLTRMRTLERALAARPQRLCRRYGETMDTQEQNLKHKKLHRTTKARKARPNEKGGGGGTRATRKTTKINGRFYSTILRTTKLRYQVMKQPLAEREEGDVIPGIQE
ncbi:Protein ssh4 [Venturia inaequalis]|uniref:Protein SSH4 n=1 Tax=Venturia inaequalis TaxID=5025 RepID=A0A8H3YQH0_VENIN|nr:hypothetical protein EG327_010502 [Venturia inaequalis]KAE9977136.1 hypothetical protein EG328_002199 [Venturia inaequalis]KAE9984787.1 Protein ssh4 [Venturia inaequalis]